MGAEEQINPRFSRFPHAKDVIHSSESNELFFAVVGHVGSGISEVANTLQAVLEGQDYQVEKIKASTAIKEWAIANDHAVPRENERALIQDTFAYQDLGDLMRKHTQDYAAVAQGLIKNVRKIRGERTNKEVKEGEPVDPDETKRAYIFDSIRHPAEVNLLRTVYSDSFTLIGIVCQESVRKDRLLKKFFDHKDQRLDVSICQVEDLMARDADDKAKDHGQHVADAFFESDYFVDNTVDSGDKQNWEINEILGRLIDIVTHERLVRPTVPETAMHHAMTAQIRSACLSRQVGAAIVDSCGDIIATGTNEVPMAGGGVYGKIFSITDRESNDKRCYCSEHKGCSSNREQNDLAEKLMASLEVGKEEPDLIEKLRKAGLKDLLEFSRAVHAEMDAITTAARSGKALAGARMYVTTFPCHYCARHIVASGIHEVQYIEPYPKSRAMILHEDAITSEEIDWVAPRVIDENKKGNKNYQKVLFKPFVGVSPRLYARAFTKDRPLKNSHTGIMDIGEPKWGSKWSVKRLSYTQLEAELTKVETNGD